MRPFCYFSNQNIWDLFKLRFWFRIPPKTQKSKYKSLPSDWENVKCSEKKHLKAWGKSPNLDSGNATFFTPLRMLFHCYAWVGFPLSVCGFCGFMNPRYMCERFSWAPRTLFGFSLLPRNILLADHCNLHKTFKDDPTLYKSTVWPLDTLFIG